MTVKELNNTGLLELVRESIGRPARPPYLLELAVECRQRGLLVTEDVLLKTAADRMLPFPFTSFSPPASHIGLDPMPGGDRSVHRSRPEDPLSFGPPDSAGY
jgi:hypothetical protein